MRNSKLVLTLVMVLLLVTFFSISGIVQARELARHVWTFGTVDPETKGTFRISTWETSFEVATFADEIQTFFDTFYPNIEVQFDWGGGFADYWTKLPVLIASDNGPDLSWMHDSRIKSYACLGAIEDLSGYINDLPPLGWEYDWYPSQIKSFQYNGDQYAIPMDLAPRGVYFNKDMFDKAEIEYPKEDWTYDDMLNIAKKLTKDIDNDGKLDQYGVYMRLDRPHVANDTILCFGGKLFDLEEGKAYLNDPGTIEAIQFLADLVHKWKVQPIDTTNEAKKLFAAGKLGMLFALNDETFGFNEVIGDSFNWGVTEVPTGPAGRYQYIGGSAMAIPKSARYPKISYELIRFLLSNPETLPRISNTRSTYVARMSFFPFALNAELYKKIPNYHKVFAELAVDCGVEPPFHAKFTEFASLWTRYLDPVFITGQEDAKTACGKLQKEAQKLMDELK